MVALRGGGVSAGVGSASGSSALLLRTTKRKVAPACQTYLALTWTVLFQQKSSELQLCRTFTASDMSQHDFKASTLPPSLIFSILYILMNIHSCK